MLLARHKNVHFHYIPKHAIWLNQLEVWFSLFGATRFEGSKLHLLQGSWSSH
jgi:hypothetical protein